MGLKIAWAGPGLTELTIRGPGRAVGRENGAWAGPWAGLGHFLNTSDHMAKKWSFNRFSETLGVINKILTFP